MSSVEDILENQKKSYDIVDKKVLYPSNYRITKKLRKKKKIK